MRIIAGQNRGRTLKTLKGSNTRPTTDRVREALMSSIFSARGSFEGAVVLDAFAGSGALGLECLSRGAAFAVECEAARDAARIIEENIRGLGLDKSQIVLRRGDVFTLPAAANVVFDIVFLDPPYKMDVEDVLSLIKGLEAANALSEDALICYEFSKTDRPGVDDALSGLNYSTISSRNYGDTSLAIIRKVQR